jgi:anti-sigma regulatory factor (Ser/Thr protein kinase)
MPLGLMPGSPYEEKEVTIERGEIVLFTSDGIAEAHNPDGEMFGCPRIISLVEAHQPDEDLRDEVLAALDHFTGPEMEQEDDITMVTLERMPYEAADFEGASAVRNEIMLEFELPSAPGNERLAMARVADAIEVLGLPTDKFEKIKTAVAEATMNAIEHGNKNDPELMTSIQVTASDQQLRIRITDHGGGEEIPEQTAPDLDAKLRGEQTPRGWGLFLIKAMVDEMHVTSDDVHHTVELVINLRGAG